MGWLGRDFKQCRGGSARNTASLPGANRSCGRLWRRGRDFARRKAGMMAPGKGLNLQAILQACTVCVLVWFGSRIVTVSETVAVHEYRLNDQSGRIQQLETRKL
jgi:hypothetical protein